VSGFRIFILAAATLAVTPIWFIYLDLLREIWSGNRDHGAVGNAVGITLLLGWMYLLVCFVGVDA